VSNILFGQLRKKTVILEAGSKDHRGIAGLHRRAFTRGWSQSEIAKLALQPNVTMLVARAVGDPDGPVMGMNILRHTEDEAEILSIAVNPKGRRRGLGDALMREAILRLRANRVGALFLEVDGSNDAAISLYRKLGFQAVGSRPGYYGGGDEKSTEQRSNALVMRMDLG
jgi:ribosomal-protein-alanine N-acetyltransferase